jgi:hypothetical protein
MKKLWIITAAVVATVGAGVVVVVTSSDKKHGKTNTTSMGHSVTLGSVNACDILTPAVAKKVLSEDAERGIAAGDSSSDDITVSNCIYSSKTGDSLERVRDMRTASLLVRSPLTQAGADSNHTPFHSLKEGAVEISGYGDMAFWDPELGQLNVLKDGSWYILSIGKAGATDHSIEESKAFARTLGLAQGR